MKRNSKTLTAILFIAAFSWMASCKKTEAEKPDLATTKKEWLTGTWKQKDIQLAVSTTVKVGGTKIPLKAGMSMLDDPTINMLLQALGGNPFVYTRDNTYSFNSDGTYKITGITEFPGPIKIVAGNSGTWDTQVYSSVVDLFPGDKVKDPHWINNITATKLNLALMVALPGLGDVPMNLLLEKQ